MKHFRNTWAVVLAAGEGTRLATLTTDLAGNAVPKQFCSLHGGESLLQEALHRAARVVDTDRVCAIVAEQHRRYWRPMLWSMPAANIIVQPGNRGTAHGIALSVLAILARDPLARIVFLPADHHVADESALAGAIRSAAGLVARDARGLALVGIEPDEPDPELGYIVPGQMLSDGSYTVQRFVEKPHASLASELMSRGALWNSFIFAADGASLLGLFRRRMAESLEVIETALARENHAKALNAVYEELPIIDFSRTVMQGSEKSLRVIGAPVCGWSDLGTPKRVAETLRRLDDITVGTNTAFINLAAQHARLGHLLQGSMS